MYEHSALIPQCKGASMLPTISPSGDLVLHARLPFLRVLSMMPFATSELKSRYPEVPPDLPAKKLDPSAGLGLRLGDMVVAISPSDPSRTICKRILGMPGDTVLVDPREGVLSDAAELLAAHFEAGAGAALPLLRMQSSRTVTVPPGHVWLTGDNLANSTDSRNYGPVPMALIKGRVIARCYPRPQWFAPALKKVRPAMDLAADQRAAAGTMEHYLA